MPLRLDVGLKKGGDHMDKRIVKEVIKEFQEWELPEALPREIDVPS